MLAAIDVPPPDTLKLPARVCLMGKRGLILAGLQVLLTSLTATAGPSEVALPAFSFTGRAPSPVLEVPAFSFVGRAFVPGVDVPAFTFLGRMPMPVVDVPPFSFAGRGGTSLVVAGKDKTLPVFGLAPRSVTTAPLVMTGRRPQDMTINTGALQMTGRRSQDTTISTGKLQMTGRRGSFGESAGFGQTRPGGDSPAQDGSRPVKPVFRLFRVVPLGAAGTNPFDSRDVRSDVAAALAGGSVTAPLDPGTGVLALAGGSVTAPLNPVAVVIVPAAPTALTLSAALPGIEVKAGVPAHIQIDTLAQTVSAFYNGAPQPSTATTALSLSVNLIAFSNVNASLNAVAPWTVLSRDYPQPFNSSLNTCTVLRYSDGVYYQLRLGLTMTNTGFRMNALSASRHGTSQPTCP